MQRVVRDLTVGSRDLPMLGSNRFASVVKPLNVEIVYLAELDDCLGAQGLRAIDRIRKVLPEKVRSRLLVIFVATFFLRESHIKFTDQLSPRFVLIVDKNRRSERLSRRLIERCEARIRCRQQIVGSFSDRGGPRLRPEWPWIPEQRKLSYIIRKWYG